MHRDITHLLFSDGHFVSLFQASFEAEVQRLLSGGGDGEEPSPPSTTPHGKCSIEFLFWNVIRISVSFSTPNEGCF